MAASTASTSRCWLSLSAVVVRSCASRPLMNGLLPTTTTAASAPRAAATACATPLPITSREKCAAPAAVADPSASLPSAPTVT
ncbi:hypothetical protein [Actinoplanes nipponensis]|uniref:hypothetical protein n=1 Tax=Actinoplanes nipponensis TaxID=135950 RepID=UPI0031E9FA91